MASETETPGETPDAEPGTGDREPKPTEPIRTPVKPARPAVTAKPEPEAEPENLEDALEALARLQRRVTNLTEEKDRHKRKADEFRTVAEEKQRAEEAKLTENERLGKRLTTVEREKADADATVAFLQDQLVKARVSFALQLAAHDMDFRYPADVPGLVKHDAIECDDDGEPLKASVEKALKKLAETRPDYLKTVRGGTPPRDAARRGAGGPGRPSRNDPYEQELASMGKGGRM